MAIFVRIKQQTPLGEGVGLMIVFYFALLTPTLISHDLACEVDARNLCMGTQMDSNEDFLPARIFPPAPRSR